MKTYTFIIGSMDDFESIDDMLHYIENKPVTGVMKSNYSIFEFEAPDSCDQETVTLIGRGTAFSNDWCMDDTFSCVIEGALDGPCEKEMFEAGVQAREAKKVLEFKTDWNPSDPTNW